MSTEAEIREFFRQQSHACTKLGSPFMGRLMMLMAERLQRGSPVADRVLGWPGDASPAADNPSLRLAGALHALVIAGQAPELVAVYPPHAVPDDSLWDAVTQAMETHAAHLLRWMDQPPQTNEVRRAAALIPAWHLIAAATGRPLALWEFGCSGGLNLYGDHFALMAGETRFGPEASALTLEPDWTGPVPTALPDLAVAERRGVDLSPLDPTAPEDQLRLRAYLWPDQTDRRARTDAAMAIAERDPAPIHKGNGLDWLAAALPDRATQATTVLFHTIAWQYMTPADQARGAALLAEAGARATAQAPLAHLGMEADGGHGAALTLTLWPDGTTHDLARVDFHGRWVTWTGPTSLRSES